MDKSTTINERINKIRVDLCENDNNKFAEKIGKSKQYASSICNSAAVGKNMMRHLLEVFPDVREDWLFLDKGPMLVNDIKISGNDGGGVINNTGDNNHNSINNGSQVDTIVSLYEARLADKDALIEFLKKSVEHLSQEVTELRQWTHMCADRYIATLDDIKATTEDTNELVKECKQHIGFKK